MDPKAEETLTGLPKELASRLGQKCLLVRKAPFFVRVWGYYVGLC
jgi:hypothetical protein